MQTTVAVASALGAAALFALASAVQARALHNMADSVPPRRTGGGTEIGLRHTWDVAKGALRSPAWLVGAAISVVAFTLHALALHEGDLTLVQPLLVTVVLFALVATRLLGGPGIKLIEIGWAVLLVAGLGAFFAAAHPVSGGKTGLDGGPAVLAAVIALLATALCVFIARHRAGGEAAALLGAAAGIAFAGVAALVKSSTGLLTHGVPVLLSSWQPYAALALGAAGIVVSQLAFRAGPLAASVPAMNSINPLASVLIGVAVFDEHFRSGPLASSVEALALTAVTIATVLLSRLQRLEPGDPGAAPATPGQMATGQSS